MNATVVSPIFVGRRAELAALTAAMDRAATGDPALVLIGGEAGVGKTRLVEQATAAATAAGFLVLVGQCIELGAEGLPLAPLVDALRELARNRSPQELAELLGPARLGLARLLPELDSTFSNEATLDAGNSAQLLEMVLGTLSRISRQQPLLLVLEDLHWADQSTRELVAFLVRSLRGVRVFVVITYRSDELHRRHPLRPMLTSWDRLRTMQQLQLVRFDHAEVAAQVGAILSGPVGNDVVDVVFDRSGGNAFLVEELVGLVQGGGDPTGLPPSLRDLLLARFDALGAPAQHLMRIAAVAGRRVTDRLIAAVAGLDDAVLIPALRELVEGHLLVVDENGRGYTFRHALVRDAVYEDVLPGERVGLHAAYGDALQADSSLADNESALSATLAYHWYAALDLPRALVASVDAAQQATHAYAPAEALRHLERALEIWPRVPDAFERTGIDLVEVSQRAADAAYRAGSVDRAVSLLERALTDISVANDTTRRALLLERRAVALRDSGREAAGSASLAEAMALLPTDGVSRAHAVVLAALAHAEMRAGAMQASVRTAELAVESARSVGAVDVEADALITLGGAQSYADKPEAGLDATQAGLALARENKLPLLMLRGYVNSSDTLYLLTRHEDAVRTAREGLASAATFGLESTLGSYLLGNLMESLLRLGEWDEVDQLANDADRVEREGVFGAAVLIVSAERMVLVGRYDDAEQLVRRVRKTLADSSDIQFTHSMAYIDALIAIGRGDYHAARGLVREGIADDILNWSARYAWPLLWVGVRVEADAAVAARDRRVAESDVSRQRAAELKRLAAALPATGPAALANRQLVDAEDARRAGTDETLHWILAVEAWRVAHEAYPLAYSLVRLGESLCSSGDREAASLAVGEGLALAERLGATPLVAEATALARRGRLRMSAVDHPESSLPTSLGTAGPDGFARLGLTDREREVLALLALGSSNLQIAQQLFISPKTASVHVSNILAKLGVSGRVQAAAVAHRLGAINDT